MPNHEIRAGAIPAPKADASAAFHPAGTEAPSPALSVKSLDSHCRLVRFFTADDRPGVVTMQCISAAAKEEVVFSGKRLEAISARTQLHQHNFYELMIFLQGDGYQNIEHERHYYPAGGGCFMNRNISHQEEYSGLKELGFIQLPKAYLEALLNYPRYFSAEEGYSLRKLQRIMSDENAAEKDRRFIDLIPRNDSAACLRVVSETFGQLWREFSAPSAGSSRMIDALLIRLLCTLFDDRQYVNKSIHFVTNREWELFQAITAYLRRSHGHVSRAAIEGELHYSGDYLYKIVKKHTGLSLYDYGMKICMEEAAQLLAGTRMPIADIILHQGCTNQTQFYRIFRMHYGTSPAKYRRQQSLKTTAPADGLLPD